VLVGGGGMVLDISRRSSIRNEKEVFDLKKKKKGGAIRALGYKIKKEL